MMLKKRKILYLAYIAAGVLADLISAFSGMGDYNSGVLGGMGTALIAVGLLRLLRMHRLTRDPEKAAEFESANKDERVLFIANKARALAFMISIYGELAAGLTAQFFFGQRLLGTVLCCFACAQSLLFVGVYWYYSRKY